MAWFLAISTSVLMLLAFPSFNLFPFAWICLIPLLHAIHDAAPKRAFLLGWLSGTLFFTGLLYWIIPLYPYTELKAYLGIPVTTLTTLLLATYLGVYWGLFTLLIRGRQRPSIQWPLFVAVVWTGLEYMRAWFITGMPWGSLGYSQWNDLPAIQIADTVGVYGVSFVIAAVNASIYQLWQRRTHWRRLAIVPAVLLVITFGYGGWRLSQSQGDAETLDVAMVPGNVSQMDKLYGRLSPILQRYLRTTEPLAAESHDLIVWPETSVPASLLNPAYRRYFNQVRRLVQSQQSPLLLGVPHAVEGKYYNAAFLLDQSGNTQGHYYKIHLVPFTERVPYKEFLPKSLMERLIGSRDFEPGQEIQLFPHPERGDLAIGIVICFESSFTRHFRKTVLKGANVMGILTNDAWFAGTAAPEQHYAMAPFRAVENRVGIFRCANGGISCIIDPLGRVQPDKVISPNQGIVRGSVSLNQQLTLYTRFGNWLPFLCWSFVVALVVITLIQRRRSRA